MSDQARLAELLEEEVRLRRSHPSVFFEPNGKQEEVIRQVGEHDVRSGRVITYMLSGANDTGKTRMLAEIVANLMLGPQNGWFRYPLYEGFKRPCRIRMISSEAALKEGLLRELSSLLGVHLADGYPKKDGHTFDAVWKTLNGSRLDVYTWQMGMATHAGAFIDALILDEPGPKGIYDEATSRLRRGGPVIWGMTPVDAAGGFSADVGWIFDELRRAEVDKTGEAPWRVVYADAEDNCQKCGVRGRVPHEVIQDRKRRWEGDPSVLQARFYGRHALELGRVLKEWDDSRNIVQNFTIHPGWPRYFALDTHPAKPEVGIYAVLTPFSELVVLREIVSTGLISEVAEEIRKVFQVYGFPTVSLIDPLANTPNPITGQSVFDEYRKHGVIFSAAGSEKTEKDIGIAKIREMLKGVDGRPLLRVDASCLYTISQAKRWMLDPKTMRASKEHDDAWECIYRIVLNLPPYPTVEADALRRRSLSYRSSVMV